MRRYLIANRAEVTQNCCGRWRAGRRALGYGAVPRMLAARPGFVLLACLGFVAAAIETGCVHSQAPPVWGYYDQCAAENPSFLAMAECGRQKRMAECVANNTCSAELASAIGQKQENDGSRGDAAIHGI